MKGHTAAMFPSSTRRFGDLAFGDKEKPAAVPGIAFVPGVASFPGGLPILTAAGDHIGSIGVSGATSDQDEMCAQAGIEAIAEMLK